MQVQPVSDADPSELARPLVVDSLEVVEQAVQIGLPQFGEVGLDTALLLGKEALQLRQEFTEVGGHREAGHVWQMELVDRIHLDPLSRNIQILQQLSGESRRIPQQRIEMCRRVEDKTAPAEGGTESAEHIVPLEQENFQSRLGEDVPAEQPAYTRPDDYRVVLSRVLTAEDGRHSRQASVHCQHLTRDVAGVLAGQIEH